ncbi:MAG: anthranilate phosphoribosyltransferase [Gemmatimonadota bacterium]|nr:anthranilate phosphoribosyltransferase [Gemmatimonadota bacterium]
MNDIRKSLQRLLEGISLGQTEATELFLALAGGEQDPVAIAAVLTALRAKGETADEIRGFAIGMRKVATPQTIPDAVKAVDIVGTGGDHSNSVNISTGAALVTAALGQPVVKHGNRAVSGKTGSADVLEAMGLTLPDSPHKVAEQLEAIGFTFLFAPYFHPAMKHVAPIRKALGIRTVFNVLGPLTNPAAPPYYVLGAFDVPTAELMAQALSGMEVERGFVIHGAPSWDEATPCGPFTILDVRDGKVTKEIRDAKDVGVPHADPAELAGGDANFNATAIAEALGGKRGPIADALTIGAALALEVTGVVKTFGEGIETARDGLRQGLGDTLLDKIVNLSNKGALTNA